MDQFKKFVKQNKDKAQTHEVNLTGDQVKMINRFSDMLDISFEDTVMMLVEIQFSDIGRAYIAQSQAVKN